MLRAILFDFNGVLLDDEAVHFELFRRVLGEEGLDLPEDEYYRDYVGFDDEAGFRHAFKKANRPLTEAELDELCERKFAYYMPEIEARDFPFFPGALETIDRAIDLGLAIGVVSGALEPEIRSALSHAGRLDHFRTIVAAEHVSASKPDPEGYRLGLERLNATEPTPEPPLAAHEVLAIEDTRAGLESALGAGLYTVGVAHTYPASEMSDAHIVKESIAELDLSDLVISTLEHPSDPQTIAQGASN